MMSAIRSPMKMKEMKCANCNKDFTIPLKEWKRQTKKGRAEFFCSLSCGAIKSNRDNPRPGNIDNMGDKRYTKTNDELSPFREIVSRPRWRAKIRGLEYAITAAYVKSIWVECQSICPLTGWNLILPENTVRVGKGRPRPNTASIDRIDSSKSYVEGNVRIIAYQANVALSHFGDKCLIAFCQSAIGLDTSYQLPIDDYANFCLTKQGDEYSPFRKFYGSIKKRNKARGKEYDVDLADLKSVWDNQNGICPITGWSLLLKPRTGLSGEAKPNTASLDRIDNTKGYIKGNIRFIAYMANIAKSTFTDKELLAFCEAVVRQHKLQSDAA